MPKDLPKVELGDIVCIYRNKYNGPFKYFITRLILFFTTAWWLREPTSTVYHAEVAITNVSPTDFKVATMEPPAYRYKTRGYNRKIIFRLIEKPKGFEGYIGAYVASSMGRKYDFLRIIAMLFNWIFRTSYFTDNYKNGERDICSEAVARPFYHMGVKCSSEHPNSTAPDDIFDFCREHKEIYRVVYDAKA